MHLILQRCSDAIRAGQPAVLAGIIDSAGSTPRRAGTRMVIFTDGSKYGSIGGGAVEAACIARARELLSGRETYAELNEMRPPGVEGAAPLLCGGTARVLLQRLTTSDLPVFQQWQRYHANSEQPLLLTYLPEAGRSPSLAVGCAADEATLPDELRVILREQACRRPILVSTAAGPVFVEPSARAGCLYLAGAGHVAQALASLAATTGFSVVVIDDRPELAHQRFFPNAREIRLVPGFVSCLQDIGVDDYLVIMTYTHQLDRDVLAQGLATRAGYIGMIGSRGKRVAIYASLRDSGFSDHDLDRVHCPIGLAIGADSPEEIAVSIVAQLIQVRAESRR